MKNNNWKDEAFKLQSEGYGLREISRLLGVSYSTVWDNLSKDNVKENVDNVFRIKTSFKNSGKTIYIPDNQVKPGVSLKYLHCIGEYIATKKPDIIVSAGDFADMPSLSSYDKGKKSAEGRRVSEDIAVAVKGMSILLEPVRQAQVKDPSWKPRMVLTLGNHEERLMRHVNANPELDGLLSYDSLRYRDFGWEVYDYLEPVVVGGVTFIHYFPNPMSGKPLGGTAANVLKTVGVSVVQGHRQCLDVATRTLHTGRQQWSIIAGACYPFDEEYKGYTGNKHFRGVVLMNGLKDGSFDPCFVSLEYLMNRF